MEKKKSLKKLFAVLAIVMCFFVFVPFVFVGCKDNNTAYVVSIEKTSSQGLVDIYTITYSDGKTSTFTVTNGKNGSDGNDGSDGQDVSIQDVYNKYVEEYGEISYSEFLKIYLSLSQGDNSKIINGCLQSCLKVYTEFKVTTTTIVGWQVQNIKNVSVMCGSAVIYKMDTDYTYVITNYHVVYNQNANADNGTNIASKIVGYLYGSEASPTDTGTKQNGYTVYSYGDYGVEFEYVGGSIDYDIAVLKVETNKIKAINQNVKQVSIANDYYVGQTAIAIGNPENEGISATEGIVSVDNEYITLAIDNTSRNYRSIRIDTAIYGGSSGGGLFNVYGELIGITNAGNNTDQNINYAIPLEIVKGVTENILYYYDGTNPSQVKKATLGITVTTANSKYVYDTTLGYGKIKEDVIIASVAENSLASEFGLQQNDIIISVSINSNKINFNRSFEIGDFLLNVRAGDEVCFEIKRNNETIDTGVYTITNGDLI